MKRLLTLALVLLAAPVLAQETFSLPATAVQVTDLSGIIDATNGRTCESRALAIGCTQAAICTAAAAPGGASCTAAQARSVNVRIYPSTLAGREEFSQIEIALKRFNELKAEISKRALERLFKFCSTATQPQKDALCTDSGQAASCLLCP